MIVDKEKSCKGALVKLRISDDALKPESSAGNKTHIGEFNNKPTIGELFFMSNNGRYFRTTRVSKIVEETDNKIVFETKNSRYELTINIFDKIDFDEI